MSPRDDAEFSDVTVEDAPETGTYTNAEDIEKILDHLVGGHGDDVVSIAFCTDGDDEDSYFANVRLDGGSYAKDGGVYRFYDSEDETGADFNADEVFEIDAEDDGTYNISVELNPSLAH